MNAAKLSRAVCRDILHFSARVLATDSQSAPEWPGEFTENASPRSVPCQNGISPIRVAPDQTDSCSTIALFPTDDL